MDLQSISAQWESFGLNVGLTMDQMNRIREEVSGREGLVNYCFNRVIAAWLDGKKNMVNKEVLVKAVEGMDKILAEKLVRNKGKNNINKGIRDSSVIDIVLREQG